MKRIALSLIVVAASGAYVWSQSGRSEADDLLGPMPLSDDVPTGSIESRAPTLALAAHAAAAPAVAPASEERSARARREDDEWPDDERFEEAADEGKAETLHTISAEQIAARLQWPPLPPAPPAPTDPQKPGTVALAEEPRSPPPVPEISETASPESLVPPSPTRVVEARLPRPRPAYYSPAVAKVTPVAMRSGTMTVASNGSYADGTYTGPIADAYYGLVQIQAVVQDGRLARIKIVRYPSDRMTSVFINRRALPRLRNEAIRVQSAHVHIVSGATLTSEAFARSLDGALREARGA
jgi:uncharacterized protein with FMN-binding domain